MKEIIQLERLNIFSYSISRYGAVSLLWSVFRIFCLSIHRPLHTAGVQHNPDASTDRLRRQITSESASHHTVATVVSAHFAPVDAKAMVGGLGDKGNLFSEVKFGSSLVVASFDFNQGNGGILCAEASRVAKDGAVHVQPR